MRTEHGSDDSWADLDEETRNLYMYGHCSYCRSPRCVVTRYAEDGTPINLEFACMNPNCGYPPGRTANWTLEQEDDYPSPEEQRRRETTAAKQQKYTLKTWKFGCGTWAWRCEVFDPTGSSIGVEGGFTESAAQRKAMRLARKWTRWQQRQVAARHEHYLA